MKTVKLAALLASALCCATSGQAAAAGPAAAVPVAGGELSRHQLRAEGRSNSAARHVITTTGKAGEGWEPYRTQPFALVAGTRCPFGLAGTPLQDRERIRTLARFPGGKPKVQQVSGPLVVRYTNTDTGASVRRNLKGRATITYGEDGSFTEMLDHGRLAVGLAPTDPGGSGFFVLTGTGFRLDVSAGGGRTLFLGTGQVENLCTALAGRR